MELLKLIKNRISSEWKKTFNDNVDILNRITRGQNQKLETTNKRIDNLVLKSGGESPNEVVDARVNNKGNIYDSLQSRLLASEDKHETDVEQLDRTQSNQQLQLEQLNNSIGKLMGTYGANIDLFVSKNGSDTTGDGTEKNPFQTIQMAVNQIPLISTSRITLFISDGVYLEDVVIRGVTAAQIEIRSKNSVETVNMTTQDLPVKIRSIGFFYCSGYFRIYGIQAVDQANSPVFETVKYSFLVEQGGYLAVGYCKFGENTKALTHNSVYCGGTSKLHCYQSYFLNQNTCITSKMLSECFVSFTVTGTGNSVGMVANNATVRDGSPSGFVATTKQRVDGVGLVIAKGTVMS